MERKLMNIDINKPPPPETAKRSITFSSRRHDLIKKTEEFGRYSDSTAAAIIISKTGAFYPPHPLIDTALARYEANKAGTSTSLEELLPTMTAELLPTMTAELQKRIAEAIKNGRWDQAVQGLRPQELNQLLSGVEIVRRNVEGKIAAAEARSKAGESSSATDYN